MSNPYPEGQCTWGAANIFPCLQDTGRFGDFGDGGNWYAHALGLNLPTSTVPRQGWLASFDVDPPFGDVGAILSVSADGSSITRWGANWHLDGAMSVDVVPARLMTGCFLPPCPGTGPDGGVLASSTQQASTLTAHCNTFAWNIGSFNLCFDGVIGGLAVVAGIGLILAGSILLVAMTLRSSTRELVEPSPAAVPTNPPETQPPSVVVETPEQASAARVQRSRVRAAQRRATRQQAPPRAPRQRVAVPNTSPNGIKLKGVHDNV